MCVCVCVSVPARNIFIPETTQNVIFCILFNNFKLSVSEYVTSHVKTLSCERLKNKHRPLLILETNSLIIHQSDLITLAIN